jgi:hypothetical protein
MYNVVEKYLQLVLIRILRPRIWFGRLPKSLILHGKTKEFQQVFARPSFNAETSHESLVYRRYRLAMLTVMKGIGYVSAEIL